MHDPELIEAMTKAVAGEASDTMQATTSAFMFAALTALCTLRPDVAALLKGEAVAVPREALRWLLGLGESFEPSQPARGNFWWRTEFLKRAGIAYEDAASPYAKETPDDR